MLPELGEDFFTWDPIFNRIPNREWRRYGTDRLIRTVLTVLHEYRTEHDGAQRVGIMDLSRTHGGKFGRNFGGLGHASHQNGLDADILYPRKDGTEARATKPSQVDRELAQDLVDRFVAAGAVKVFVGPHLNLKGPKNVVVPLIYHDDHLHVADSLDATLVRAARATGVLARAASVVDDRRSASAAARPPAPPATRACGSAPRAPTATARAASPAPA